VKCEGGGGDCLPADAVAWVENRPLPQSLSEIQRGQKVLCYDHIGQSARYVAVMDVSIETAAANWVNVELEDGSTLAMTEDHPCHKGTRDIVLARDLEPGCDTLMVLKMVPVKVRAVSAVKPNSFDEEPRTRVSLNLTQPDRHSLFVAAAGQVPTMAVGSCDASPRTVKQKKHIC